VTEVARGIEDVSFEKGRERERKREIGRKILA